MRARVREAFDALLDVDPYAVFLAYVVVVAIVLAVWALAQWLRRNPLDELLADEPDLENNVTSYDALGREALR